MWPLLGCKATYVIRIKHDAEVARDDIKSDIKVELVPHSVKIVR